MSAEAPFRRYITKGHEDLQVVVNGGPGADDLNEQIQKLLEIILSVYVNTWYSHISPRERTFLPTIHTIILAVLKSITEGLNEEELLETLLVKLPVELREHIRKYRLARQEARVVTGAPTEAAISEAFHRLRPHPGITSAAEEPSHNTPPPRRPSDVVLNAAADLDDTLADAMASSIVVEDAAAVKAARQQSLRVDAVADHTPLEQNRRMEDSPYHLDPAYLPSVVDRILRSHLPEKDYNCLLERTLVNEIVGNAVLGGTLRRITQPWFWWRVCSNLIDRPSRARRDSGSRPSIGELLSKVFVWMSLAVNFVTFAYMQLYSFLMGDLLHDDLARKPRQRVSRLWLDLAEEMLSVNEGQARHEVIRQLNMLEGIAGNLADEWITSRCRRLLRDKTVIAQILSKLIDTLYPGGQPAPIIPDPSPDEAEAMRAKMESAFMEVIPAPIRYVLLDAKTDQQRHTLRCMIDVINIADINLDLFLGIFDLVADALAPTFAI